MFPSHDQAVCEYITQGIPIHNTIGECNDIRKFLFVRTVRGGAEWKDNYLGRVVRWIYSTNGDTITYKTNGYKVPKSDNSEPIMNLCDKLPDTIDKERYVHEAYSILDDIGYTNV